MNLYWYEQKLADVPGSEAWLNSADLERLRAMRFRKRRDDWLLGRWTAKNAVAILLDLASSLRDLRDIEIRPTVSGAPEVFFRDESAALSISLSHRDGIAVCALAPACALLGCDLEIVEAHGDAFACDYFSAEEQALVAQVPSAERARILTLLWSSKESALKALREGLRIDTRRVIVSIPGCPTQLNLQNGWSPLQVRYGEHQIFHGWWGQTGACVRTVLATPPPDPPVCLRAEIPDDSTSLKTAGPAPSPLRQGDCAAGTQNRPA